MGGQKPRKVLFLGILVFFLSGLFFQSRSSLGQSGTVEIDAEDYVKIGEWGAKRGDILFWWYESEDWLFVEILVFPKSEFDLLKAGDSYINYFEDLSMPKRVEGLQIPFDDTWVLVLTNESTYRDITVTYVIGTSGEMPAPTTITVTERVVEKTIETVVTTERITETITATEKTMGEFFFPILFFSISVVLIAIFKRRR